MTQRKSQQMLIVLILIGLVVAANIYGTYTFLTERVPGHNDFLPRWEGSRTFWLEGQSPYSDEATLNIQMRIFGRAVGEGEDLSLFVYPFYTSFILLPLTPLSYSWATAIWMVFLEACLILALLLVCDIVRWFPKPMFLTVLVLWALFYYFAARGLMLGQFSHLLYMLEIASVWGLYRGHPRLGGAALALSTIKPQMGIFIVPFLLLWALSRRNWDFLGGFTGGMIVLWGGSFLLSPSWLGDWITQLRLYPTYTSVGSPVETIVQYYLGLSPVITYFISGGFILLMLYYWYSTMILKRNDHFLWTVTLTLVVTALTAPRVATPQYVVFTTLIVISLCDFIRKRKVKQAGWWMAGVLALVTVLPWLHFLMTVDGSQQHISNYVPTPIVAMLILWFTRKLWWQYAPPLKDTTNTQPAVIRQPAPGDALT